MLTISPDLMRQCIDMVANEQDYIPFPDGIDAEYSVYNIPGEGVWIVEPWATEGGDYTKVQEIVLPYTFEELDYARKYHIPLLLM